MRTSPREREEGRMTTSLGVGQSSYRTWAISSFVLACHTAISPNQRRKTKTKGGKLQNQRDSQSLNSLQNLPMVPLDIYHTWDLCPFLLEPRALCAFGSCENSGASFSPVSRRLFSFPHLEQRPSWRSISATGLHLEA